jgi:pimeloyl-ACP methyl ester carboxylesterase
VRSRIQRALGPVWGAPVAWYAALLRPDRFRGVVGLSVPFAPLGAAAPTTLLPQTKDAFYYQLYFQEPGVAEVELEENPHATIRRLLFGVSGDAAFAGALTSAMDFGRVPRQGGLVRLAPDPQSLPGWLTEADVDYCADEFRRTGFRGALNWYRNMDKNWELLAPWKGAKVTVPALYPASPPALRGRPYCPRRGRGARPRAPHKTLGSAPLRASSASASLMGASRSPTGSFAMGCPLPGPWSSKRSRRGHSRPTGALTTNSFHLFCDHRPWRTG